MTGRQQRTSIRNSAHAPSARIRIVECCRCFVPTKRNLLDKASAAQSLDGNRLTGSLLVPAARLYSPDYPPTSEDNVRFASLANVVDAFARRAFACHKENV